ncbi:MAG: hypothetical protein ACP5OU_03540 [Methanothrix sp.]
MVISAPATVSILVFVEVALGHVAAMDEAIGDGIRNEVMLRRKGEKATRKQLDSLQKAEKYPGRQLNATARQEFRLTVSSARWSLRS